MSNSRNLADLLTSTGDVKSDALDNASSTPSITDSGNANAITIDSSENVGIGTSSPSEKLHVAGNIAVKGIVDVGSASNPGEIKVTNNVYDSWILRKRRSDDTQICGIKEVNSGGLAFLTGNVAGGDEKVIIKANGNVGIGTTSPNAKLSIMTTASEVEGLTVLNDDNTSEIFKVINTIDSGGYIDLRDDANVTKVRLSSYAHTYFNGGNVGIGTSSPTEKLDVDGVIKAENVTTTAQIIDMSSLSDTTYYPVVLKGGSAWTFNNYELSVRYGDGSYSAAVFCKFDFTGFSWGGNPIKLFVDSLHQTYENLLGAIGRVGYYKPILYLKGGKQYRIKASSGLGFDIFTSIDTDYGGYSSSGSQYAISIGPISESTMQASNHYLGMTNIITRTSKNGMVQLS